MFCASFALIENLALAASDFFFSAFSSYRFYFSCSLYLSLSSTVLDLNRWLGFLNVMTYIGVGFLAHHVSV